MFSGSRYAARTYGRAVLARVHSERRRKAWNDGTWDAEGGDGRWCARYDSKPLLKAKEPKGRAESERRSNAWRAVRGLMMRRLEPIEATDRHHSLV
jgi:hypothetical protein